MEILFVLQRLHRSPFAGFNSLSLSGCEAAGRMLGGRGAARDVAAIATRAASVAKTDWGKSPPACPRHATDPPEGSVSGGLGKWRQRVHGGSLPCPAQK